jgi:HD-GYP domain-containing protein (c-di-GMP phosphodiesterase class II)/DNA-binding CsgD family transcriptional regulator
LRLAELLGALSLATDLAHGVPAGTALKDAAMSVAFGRYLGLTGQDLSDVYYLALVTQLGCTSFAQEQGEVALGDDQSLRRAFSDADYTDRGEMLRLAATELASHSAPYDRVRAFGRFLGAGRGFLLAGNTAVCEASARLGERLGVGTNVSRALNEMFARWDGRLFPHPAGDGVSLISRLTHLIRVAQIHSRAVGSSGAADVVRKRRGGEFDPSLADAFLECCGDLFAGMTEDSAWDQAMEVEPPPIRLLPQSRLEEVTLAIADFTDIKSPFTLGHSRRVADLAATAGSAMGLNTRDVSVLRLGGHVHDLGGVSVPQRVWSKAGKLNRPELDAIQLHPYHTERILSASRALQPIGAQAGLHHERLDGSGYHRGVPAAIQGEVARLLAVAEVFQSLLEARSWRPAVTPVDASKVLAGEVAAGRLDRAAARAVMEAAGQPAGPRTVPWPVGLTDREVEVLRLLAAGRSNRTIAQALSVAEATIRTHALNIYGKTGVHSRAGIGLFAIEHDLIVVAKDQPNG